MQLFVTTFLPLGGSVGDVFMPLLPAHIVPLVAHEGDKIILGLGLLHALVDGIHQAELVTLALHGCLIFSAGHILAGLILAVFLEDV